MSMYPDNSTRRPFELEYARDNRALVNFFNVVYIWMAVGLAVTAAVAWFCANSATALRLLLSGGNGIMLVAALGMFAIAWGVQTAAMRINANVATVLFLIYAALMGFLIAPIFIIYRMETIGAAFLVTGGTFGAMSIYGFVTKKDLTGIGSILVMCAFGLFAASLVNIFLASNGLSWIITYGVVIVFVGLTAYETQNLKTLALQFGDNPNMAPRFAIIGSLLLYISFINLFLAILRIMGRRD